MTATTRNTIARDILLEAVARVAAKDHDRGQIIPGEYPFAFTVAGTVGKREISESYKGSLKVDSDGVATPSTPYQDIAVFLLSKMNATTQAACLDAIAVGDFGNGEQTKQAKSAISAACKQYREQESANNPKTKLGSVKPTFQRVEDGSSIRVAEETRRVG